jgi:hypothetical protein
MIKNCKYLFRTFSIFFVIGILVGGFANAAQAVSSIDIEKLTNGQDADSAPGPALPAGSQVTWTYEVANTGDELLTNITVADDKTGTVPCPYTELAAGANMTCTATGVAIAGQYENLGTVTGTAPDNSTVTDSDPSHYWGVIAAVEIRKYTNGLNADVPPGPEIPAGGQVVWNYVVTNTGNTALTEITVTDDQGVSVACPATNLEAGDSMICSGTGSATEGQYENIGTVEAIDPGNNAVTNTDISHYLGVAPEDSDGDGINDDVDQCQDSDTNTTILIGGCNTGVENKVFDTGCNMSDLIAQCAASATNHGKFVSCVASLTNGWKKAGLITGKEHGSIQRCAARADIP